MELNIIVKFHSDFRYICLRCDVLYRLILLPLTILGIWKCEGSVVTSDFSKIQKDSNLVTSYPVKFSRSLLECSQYCASTGSCCGFNYNRLQKTCICLYEMDFSNPDFEIKMDTAVYLHKSCERIYQISSTTTNSLATTRSTSVTPTTTKQHSTTTDTKTISTSPQSFVCISDALLCLTNVIYLFSGDNVHTYDAISDVTSGPKTTQNTSSVFQSTSDKVRAAYADSSTIYLFQENGEVHAYFSSSLTFKEVQSWSQHFGTDVITSIDDVIFTSSGDKYVINGDIIYIISNNGKVTSSRLDNNGNNNVYKSTNFESRPLSISAACDVGSDTHAFISNLNSLFLFKFSITTWSENSSVVC